jgi:hypothetical protein
MECILTLAIVAVILVVAFKLFWSLDCDITLTLCSKFGRSLGSFKGQVVWITGPASGIEQQIAFHLAGNGAKLALSDLNMEALGNISLCATRWRFAKIAFSALPLMMNFRRKRRLFALFSLAKMAVSFEWDHLKKFCFQIWDQDLLLDLAM